MVDGVLSSCYASYDHDLAHLLMIPVQYFPKIMGWMFGDDNGYHAYIITIEDFGRWILPHELMYM